MLYTQMHVISNQFKNYIISICKNKINNLISAKTVIIYRYNIELYAIYNIIIPLESATSCDFSVPFVYLFIKEKWGQKLFF